MKIWPFALLLTGLFVLCAGSLLKAWLCDALTFDTVEPQPNEFNSGVVRPEKLSEN